MEALKKLFVEVANHIVVDQIRPFVEQYAKFQETPEYRNLLTRDPEDADLKKMVAENNHTPMGTAMELTLALRRINTLCYFTDFLATEDNRLVVSVDALVDTHDIHLLLDAIYEQLSSALRQGKTGEDGALVLHRWPTMPKEVRVNEFILNCPATLTRRDSKYSLHFLHNEFKSETDHILKTTIGKWGYKSLLADQHYYTDVDRYNHLVRDDNVVMIPGTLVQTTFVKVVEYLKGEIARINKTAQESGADLTVNKRLFGQGTKA